MNKDKLSEILPWTYAELQTLLVNLISLGTETAKIDFKAEIELSLIEQKSELLKDLSAIANTFDDNNGDYGFIIYGVKDKRIHGISNTENNTDKLQNTIEQLTKTYLSPMLQVYVIGFETITNEKWGVIVIPPRRNRPCMFFKDVSCSNPAKSRKKGEWFVRRGSTTDSGLPEDLSIITQRQLQFEIEPLQETIKTLQLRIAKVEDQYDSALFKLIERALKTTSSSEAESKEDLPQLLTMDLSSRLKHKLRTPTDRIAQDLLEEAKKIKDFIENADTLIPWAPQLQDKDNSKKYIENLENVTRQFLLSLAVIILNDSKEQYTGALMRSLKLLTKKVHAPSGLSYNRIGPSIRCYPLMLILYTTAICAVAANRPKLLKQILELPLKDDRYDDSPRVTYVYFASYDAKALFNEALDRSYCEPIAMRIKQFIVDNIGELFTDRSEAEYFFPGEFVLALNNICMCLEEGRSEDKIVPLGGLYLYFDAARNPVIEFIRENSDFLDIAFNHKIQDVLGYFDSNASKMEVRGCSADTFNRVKMQELYMATALKKLSGGNQNIQN